MNSSNDQQEEDSSAIAIVGMAGRFPGAASVDELWKVIAEGRDTISRFTPEELEGSELGLEEIRRSNNYVRARGILDHIGDFDARFFGLTPRKAELLDPQHRLWLEVAWEALEQSGHAHPGYAGAIGVFAGSFQCNYLLNNVLQDRRAIEEYVRMRRPDSFSLLLDSDPAFLPSRTAYTFGLKGPAVNVQTACSTSLVAVSMSIQSLLSYESDVCIAGGVCISIPQRTGYFHQEGAILSRDGTCRPYDSGACGTVFGSGAGAVVLKRLGDALEDGDHIHAVIRGAAINNDGHHKVSFVAPSVEGQAEVIAMAQGMANIDVETIGYMEGHGTATPMGDPIEVAALTRAFREHTQREGFCVLGSVKGNIGHLDAAAGVTGLIKTVLILKNRYLPPASHSGSPNPELRLEKSPFVILSEGREWTSDGSKRRAAVSSFGIGGTNAHVILEEAPEPAPRSLAHSPPKESVTFLPLSAKSKAALDATTGQLAEWLDAQAANAPYPDQTLADAAHTLQHRREHFRYRRVISGRNLEDIRAAFADKARWATESTPSGSPEKPQLIFMLPGQGSLEAGLTASLIENEPVFAKSLEAVCILANPHLGMDLWAWFCNPDAQLEEVLHDNARLQLSIFAFEVALVRLLESWGIRPDVLLGHSLGEWTAVHVASILSLEDAVTAVFHRGRLMQSTKGGAMAVRLSKGDALRYENEDTSLAAVNAPAVCLLSGSDEGLERAGERLKANGVAFKALPIHVPVHSPQMDSLVEPFAKILGQLSFKAPSARILSTSTGTWLTKEQATDPHHWAAQLRQTVDFREAISRTKECGASVLLEVGPGQALAALARPQLPDRHRQRAIALLGHVSAPTATPAGDPIQRPTHRALMRGIGRLWATGFPLDFTPWGSASAGRVAPLPTYPFQRTHHWIEAPSVAHETDSPHTLASSSQGHAPAPGSSSALERTQSLLSELSGYPLEHLVSDVPFGDLGLDSLFLAQFAETARSRLGVPLDLGQLLVTLNDIKALAAYIEANEKPASETPAAPDPTPHSVLPFTGLVAIRKTGSRIPFVLIHGDGAVQHLRKNLHAEQPFYTYIHQCVSGDPLQHKTVESLASQCAHEIMEAIPSGPCIVGGHSFGGSVAQEVAHLLQQAGREVRGLILIDTFHPSALPDGWALRSGPFRTFFFLQLSRFRESRAIAKANSYSRRGLPIPVELRSSLLLSTYARAFRKHKPRKLDCSTLLLMATIRVRGVAANGWNETLNNLKHVAVEADHLSLVRSPENIEVVCKEIERYISSL